MGFHFTFKERARLKHPLIIPPKKNTGTQAFCLYVTQSANRLNPKGLIQIAGRSHHKIFTRTKKNCQNNLPVAMARSPPHKKITHTRSNFAVSLRPVASLCPDWGTRGTRSCQRNRSSRVVPPRYQSGTPQRPNILLQNCGKKKSSYIFHPQKKFLFCSGAYCPNGQVTFRVFLLWTSVPGWLGL